MYGDVVELEDTMLLFPYVQGLENRAFSCSSLTRDSSLSMTSLLALSLVLE